MEKVENGATAPATLPPVQKSKKRGGGMNFFRAAMMAIRGDSKKNTVTAAAAAAIVDTDAVLKSIVAGVRPLQYRIDYERPAPPPPPPLDSYYSYYDSNLPPPSPCSSTGMSRYASAEDLQILDENEENEEEVNGDGEPNAIDMKADEFIAMFYKQMSLQRSESLKVIEEEGVEESVEH